MKSDSLNSGYIPGAVATLGEAALSPVRVQKAKFRITSARLLSQKADLSRFYEYTP